MILKIIYSDAMQNLAKPQNKLFTGKYFLPFQHTLKYENQMTILYFPCCCYENRAFESNRNSIKMCFYNYMYKGKSLHYVTISWIALTSKHPSMVGFSGKITSLIYRGESGIGCFGMWKCVVLYNNNFPY